MIGIHFFGSPILDMFLIFHITVIPNLNYFEEGDEDLASIDLGDLQYNPNLNYFEEGDEDLIEALKPLSQKHRYFCQGVMDYMVVPTLPIPVI
jgi:hypothetical protein